MSKTWVFIHIQPRYLGDVELGLKFTVGWEREDAPSLLAISKPYLILIIISLELILIVHP